MYMYMYIYRERERERKSSFKAIYSQTKKTILKKVNK